MKIVSLFYLLFSFTSVMSQTNFGLKVGGSYNSIENICYGEKDLNGRSYSFVGQLPYAGIYVQHSLNSFIGSDISFIFQTKGGDAGPQYNPNAVGGIFDDKHAIERLNYVSLPINLTLFPELKFNLTGGVSGSYLLSTPWVANSPGATIKRWELAWQLGVRYNFNHFSVSLQYSKAFNHWIDELQSTGNGVQYFNKGWQASISVPLNKLF